MQVLVTHRWTLASVTPGWSASDFELQTQPLPPDLPPDWVLVKVAMFSVRRNWFRKDTDDLPIGAAVEIGDLIPAYGLGVVVQSRSNKFNAGERVTGPFGAQSYVLIPATALSKVARVPGVPSEVVVFALTQWLFAWTGINTVLTPPRHGETVLINAAGGAVGGAAAQLARSRGAKVIGVSRASKARFLRDTLGLSGVIDYRNATHTVGAQLDLLAPDGIDFYFDDVEGQVLLHGFQLSSGDMLIDTVVKRMRPGGRIVVCEAVPQYAVAGCVRGPSRCLMGTSGARRGHMADLKVSPKLLDSDLSFLRSVLGVIMAYWRGTLRLPWHVEEGLQSFPAAVMLVISGEHTGKVLVRLF